jgi:hypothetical protein
MDMEMFFMDDDVLRRTWSTPWTGTKVRIKAPRTPSRRGRVLAKKGGNMVNKDGLNMIEYD